MISVPANIKELIETAETIAVIFAALFTMYEVRRWIHDSRFRNYFDAIAGFVSINQIMLEKAELHRLYDGSPEDLTKGYGDMSREERNLIHYCDMLIALCEAVWRGSRRKLMYENEWEYWGHWIRELHKSPYWRKALEWDEDQYDKDFIRAVRSLSESVTSSQGER